MKTKRSMLKKVSTLGGSEELDSELWESAAFGASGSVEFTSEPLCRQNCLFGKAAVEPGTGRTWTKLEFEVFQYLYDHKETAVSRASLVEEV
jgi:hypothetical protein